MSYLITSFFEISVPLSSKIETRKMPDLNFVVLNDELVLDSYWSINLP
jgi:hypothetical protein